MSGGTFEEEVFETTDETEDEMKGGTQGKSEEKEEKREEETKGEASLVSEEMVEFQIKPTPGFQRFAGKPVDSSKKDWQSETFANDTPMGFESPLQKYQRLRREISEFETELSQISRIAEHNAEEPTKAVMSEVNAEISKLWGNVEEFRANPQLASLFAEADAAVLETLDASHLFKRLQEMEASEPSSEPSGAEAKAAKATLTLYHDGSIDKESYRLREVNERLKRLETIVGPKSAESGSMMRNIEYLQQRLDLLCDEGRLEALKRRVQSLKKGLSEIKFEGDTAMEEQITKSKEQKIMKMFEMMERWDQTAQALPTVVTRLNALKNLHRDAADMLHKVESLDTQQSLIRETLQENQAMLKQVNESLAANARVVTANVESIESRIGEIQERVKRLRG